MPFSLFMIKSRDKMQNVIDIDKGQIGVTSRKNMIRKITESIQNHASTNQISLNVKL